jgi:transcription initiation factor TFIIIB Brf1 subunit/transcription initiation factor TFIIB
MDYCPECGKNTVIQSNEGKICTKCGLVLEEDAYFAGRMLLI